MHEMQKRVLDRIGRAHQIAAAKLWNVLYGIFLDDLLALTPLWEDSFGVMGFYYFFQECSYI